MIKSYNNINVQLGRLPLGSPAMQPLVPVIRWAWEAVRVLLRAWEAVRRPQKALCDLVALAIARPLARVLLGILGCRAPEPNLVEMLTAALTEHLLGFALNGAVAALI